MAIKGVQKTNIIRAIEHIFVWCIIYTQPIPNVSIKTSKK